MKSLDRQSLDDQTRLVSRYVAGDLSRSERAEFEAWLVASPELAAEVEMERRLRRGMASAARRGWLKRGAGNLVARPHRRWQMAAAASVVLAVTATATVYLPRTQQDAEITATTRAAAPAIRKTPPRTVRLSMVRSLGTTPDVTFSLAEVPSELRIEPDVVVFTCHDGTIELECPGGTPPRTPQYTEYEMELVNRRGSLLAWRSPRQLPGSSSVLSYVVPAPESLPAGDYDMIVRGHGPDHEEVVARFWLRIIDR